MKKVFLFLLVAIALLFISNKIYQYYSRNTVNSHESIVLFNNTLDEAGVDSFFGLQPGIYDSEQHVVVFSLLKKNGSLLDYYLNLPVKNLSGMNAVAFECDNEYTKMRPYGFYDYQVGNRNIIARVITKQANRSRNLKPDQTLAKKYLNINFRFGEIQVFDIRANGASNHCN